MTPRKKENTNEILGIISITLGILGIVFSMVLGVGLAFSLLSFILFVILKLRSSFNRLITSTLILSVIGISLSTYVLFLNIEEGVQEGLKDAMENSQEMLFKVLAKDTAYNERLAKELTKIDSILNDIPGDSAKIDSASLSKKVTE